jgi:hypothetical protein
MNDSGDERHDRVTPEGGSHPGAGHASKLIFKTCVVALWVDGSMAAAERDYLSHLIDTVGATEAERDELRKLALHDVNRHAVFAEIDGLSDSERQHLFDRCVAVLTSDRRVRRAELRFLSELRRHCGIGFWRYQRVSWGLSARRRVPLLVLVGIAAALGFFVPWGSEEEAGVPPRERAGFSEVFLAPVPAERPALAPEALYQLVRRSVATVNVRVDGSAHGNGTGSVIAVDGLGQLYVLTNRHVVYHELSEGQELEFEVELESGVRLPGVLDFYSRQWDLALLVVPKLTGWARPVPLRPKNQLRVGQKVYALGSPMGLDHTFTSGLISAFRDAYIQTDATVHAGSSGGPLFDGSGLVCGVITTTHEHKDLSFALCADAVIDMFAERRAAKTSTATPGL